MKQLHIKSKPIKSEGYLLPWNTSEEQPLCIMIEDIMFIPVFSNREKYDEHMDRMGYRMETKIKQITDTDEFLESVQPYRVALDPRPTEYNTTRFTELKFEPR